MAGGMKQTSLFCSNVGATGRSPLRIRSYFRIKHSHRFNFGRCALQYPPAVIMRGPLHTLRTVSANNLTVQLSTGTPTFYLTKHPKILMSLVTSVDL